MIFLRIPSKPLKAAFVFDSRLLLEELRGVATLAVDMSHLDTVSSHRNGSEETHHLELNVGYILC